MVTATRQDSTYYTHTLPNGLRMIGQYMPGTQSASIIFWVKTGTRDEAPEQMGVSHFLEHMGFRRTRNYTGAEIDHAFEAMGADHNAATWLEMTFYWARVLSENTSWAIDVVSDLTRPALDAGDFDQERNVILEEIARYEDIPSHVLLSQFMRDFFGDNPLSYETLGTNQTIRDLTVEEMRSYWKSRYGTDNIVFAIAGNFQWNDVIQQIEALTGDWHRSQAERRLERAPFTPVMNVVQRPKFVQEQIAIGVPSVSRSDPRFYAAEVLATILGDDTGSRLYWALHETGLAESATSQVMSFQDNGLILVHIATEPGKAKQALDVALAELDTLQRFDDIRPDELERAKSKIISSAVIAGESTYGRSMAIVRSWLAYGRLQTLEELRQEIEKVSLDDLRDLLQEFPIAPNQVITTVGPLSEAELSLQ